MKDIIKYGNGEKKKRVLRVLLGAAFFTLHSSLLTFISQASSSDMAVSLISGAKS